MTSKSQFVRLSFFLFTDNEIDKRWMEKDGINKNKAKKKALIISIWLQMRKKNGLSFV